MKDATLIHCSVLAAVVLAGIIGAGLFTTGTAVQPHPAADPVRSMTTGERFTVTGTTGLPAGAALPALTGTAGSGARENTGSAPEARPYIRIDPIGNRTTGSAFRITGTTSLPAGSDLLVQVYASSFNQSASQTGEFSGAIGVVRVEPGTGGAGTWSMDIDTTVFVPMEYIAVVSAAGGEDAAGIPRPADPQAEQTFMVRKGAGSGAPGAAARAVPGGILLDPIRDTKAGSLLAVSGRTSLPEGTLLMIRIVPSAGENGRITARYNAPENIAIVPAARGKDNTSTFSALLDTRSLAPAEHIVIVTDIRGAAAGIDAAPGSFTGSAVFTILAGNAEPEAAPAIPAIYINPVPGLRTGDPLVITGTTNLPAGTALAVSVIPSAGTDPAQPELAAAATVGKGAGSANLFLAVFPMAHLPAGDHIVLVSAEQAEVTGSILVAVTP